jgi:hypothetical protein
MAVKREFKSDLITVVNGDFVEQLWVKVIIGGKSLYMFVLSIFHRIVMLFYMKWICLLWSLCL